MQAYLGSSLIFHCIGQFMVGKEFSAQEQVLIALVMSSNPFFTHRIINTTLFLVVLFQFQKKMDDPHIPR